MSIIPFGENYPLTRLLENAPKLGTNIFDSTVVASLKSTYDPEGLSLWEKSIKLYLETAPTHADQIRDAIAEQNAEMLRKAAHSLKSSSAKLGAKHLAYACLVLETAGRDQLVSGSEALVLDFEKGFQQVMDVLKKELHHTSKAYPVKEEQTNTQSESTAAAKILIVDDDPFFRMIIVEVLQTYGFEIFQANSGNDALRKLKQQNNIDLIILDAMMDDMDGFEACEAFRADPETDEIPIIISTGLNDTASINRAFKAGASDFIVKPINYRLLVHHIRFLLRANQNVSKLRKNQLQLSQAQRIARLGYWTWNAEQNTIEISPYLTEMCNICSDKVDQAVTLEVFLDLVHPEDRSHVKSAIYSTLARKENNFVDFRLVDKQANILQVRQETAFLSENIVTGTVQDITRHKESEVLIYQLAYTDKLTGLSNRAFYQKHINCVINFAKLHNTQLALLFLDLDEFKYINDSFGHDVGDQFLQVIAQRIKTSIRDVDIAIRLGGDEFCILLDDIAGEDTAIAVAERCLVEINQPALLEGTLLKPRVSVGIALYPKDADNEHDLMKAADAAMYSAKTAGKQRFARYRPDMASKALTRLKEEQMLTEAIQQHQFVLHYQPQINLLTGDVEGVEALLRWQHPSKNLVAPQDFIGLAESLGLINRLEDWVLHSACQQMMDWLNEGLPLVTLAVNISSVHLRDRRLLDAVKSAITTSKLPPEYLELEVTESALQLENDISIFADLKQLGIKLSINNFGSSFSTLTSLNRIPLDCLKIDRRIVKDSSYNKNIPIMLGALINIANTNGYKLVAEGIETIDQLLIVSGLGCYIFQGYFFHKPVPSDQLPAVFAKKYLLEQPVHDRRSKDVHT